MLRRMRDVAEKTRFAVQMALAARALVAATPDPHRKRVVGRYVFIYLDDVVRFAPAWRNALAKSARQRAAAAAAAPALRRLQRDWEHYCDVRDYIAAKRQPRDRTDAAVDQLESFKLWADIGEPSVEILVDDATEVYAQLSAVVSLAPIQFDPQPAPELVDALQTLDGVGEAGQLELTATSFGAGKAGAYSVRQGGDVGRLTPLLNDVAENIQTLRALTPYVSGLSPFEQLLRCQLPTEIDELLRLSVGPAPNAPAASDPTLLALFTEQALSSEATRRLEQLRDDISKETREQLHDWRNRIGAHIDADTPWNVLEAGLDAMDLTPIERLADHVLLALEATACEPGGPVTLLLEARRLKGEVIDRLPAGHGGLPFAASDMDPGSVPSALPPPQFADSHHMIWVSGPAGHMLSAAVAGMIAGRSREVNQRLEAASAASASPRRKKQLPKPGGARTR
jgi:hypothetical protein